MYYFCLDSDAYTGSYLPDVVAMPYIDFDVPNIAIYNNYTLDQCQATCASTPGCVGFVINCSDGYQCGGSATYLCALKSALGASNIVPKYYRVTLVKLNGQYAPIVGVDFPNNDITSINGTIQDCISACDNNPACGMFFAVVGYYYIYPISANSVNQCYLKTNTNIDWKFNDGNQSYVMPKTTISGIHSMFTCIPCAAGE